MTPLQIITLSGSIILIAAIAATTFASEALSRDGLGLFAFAITRFRSGYWPTNHHPFCSLVTLAGGLMLLFELGHVVLSVLWTLKDPCRVDRDGCCFGLIPFSRV